jgi:hypothetical protein
MTLDQDEAIARSCGCGQFDEDADEYWEDLTISERWDLGKSLARLAAVAEERRAMLDAYLADTHTVEVPF